MITFHTIGGDVTVPEPTGFWERIRNLNVEGHIFYKGFRANFRHGSDPDEETQIFGCIDNIHNAAYILNGDNMQDYVKQFHEDVDEFLLDIDNGEFGGHPIEYYTDDTELLDYYNKYHRKNGVQLNRYHYEQEEGCVKGSRSGTHANFFDKIPQRNQEILKQGQDDSG